MKNVDVDGNGSVDIDEFEHMTRKLLSIACQLPCRTCRLLHQRQEQNNWPSNMQLSISTMHMQHTEAHAAHASGVGVDVFRRVSSSPATPAESQKAEQEALSRQAASIQHRHILEKSRPSSKTDEGLSSNATLASALPSSVDGPESPPPTLKSPGGARDGARAADGRAGRRDVREENSSQRPAAVLVPRLGEGARGVGEGAAGGPPYLSVSPTRASLANSTPAAGPKGTRRSPSRVASKLHDALASASADQRASRAKPPHA